MAEKNNKPEIRFNGFTEVWEEQELRDVAIYRNGKAHENDINEKGEYIVVNSKFVSTDGKVKKFSDKQIEPLFKNEIAFVLSDVPNGRAVARTFLVEKDDKYTLNQRIAGISPLEITESYFLHILLNRHPYFLQFDDGVKQTNLSKEDVEKFANYYPGKIEQTQIGTFFRNIDLLITLQQLKYDKLVTIKKAMLEKMFPKNGSYVPEIRFKGFTEAWEVKELGEVLYLLKDGTHGTHIDVEHDGVYLLSAKNIKNGKITIGDNDRKISIDDYNGIHKSFNLQKGDVLLTVVGSIGESAIIENPNNITFQRSVAYLRPNKELSSQFLLTTINTTNFQCELKNRQVTSAQPGIYLGLLGVIPILLPKKNEQLKIGTFFEVLDNLITLQKRELEKLKNIKKACLEKMFV